MNAEHGKDNQKVHRPDVKKFVILAILIKYLTTTKVNDRTIPDLTTQTAFHGCLRSNAFRDAHQFVTS